MRGGDISKPFFYMNYSELEDHASSFFTEAICLQKKKKKKNI